MVEPDSSADTIEPSALISALGASRSEFYRARARGDIPAPDRPTLGGRARWSLGLAAEIVKGAGKDLPRAWSKALNRRGAKSAKD